MKSERSFLEFKILVVPRGATKGWNEELETIEEWTSIFEASVIIKPSFPHQARSCATLVGYRIKTLSNFNAKVDAPDLWRPAAPHSPDYVRALSGIRSVRAFIREWFFSKRDELSPLGPSSLPSPLRRKPKRTAAWRRERRERAEMAQGKRPIGRLLTLAGGALPMPMPITRKP